MISLSFSISGVVPQFPFMLSSISVLHVSAGIPSSISFNVLNAISTNAVRFMMLPSIWQVLICFMDVTSSSSILLASWSFCTFSHKLIVNCIPSACSMRIVIYRRSAFVSFGLSFKVQRLLYRFFSFRISCIVSWCLSGSGLNPS